MALTLTVETEVWPLADAFVISRGAKTEAHVVVATVTDGNATGRGECVPYARYGETNESVVAALHGVGDIGERSALQFALPAGAARNALDCALWDLAAKARGVPAYILAGQTAPQSCETVYTLSLADADTMAAKAKAVPHQRMLKLKLGGAGDAERMMAVRAARPDARLVADANEGWTAELLLPMLAAAAEAGLELIEQPLPAAADGALLSVPHLVPICADESVHTCRDLAGLVGRYDAVNIKLDKAGGLTEALAMASDAKALGFKIMVGCMVATSLSMAPAFLVAQLADWVDLDGPLLLSRDREHGLRIADGWIMPPSAELWG